MKVVAILGCDNCGRSIINDPDTMTMFVVDGEITGATICPQCKEPITAIVAKTDAINISKRGVKIFSWETGTEIKV